MKRTGKVEIGPTFEGKGGETARNDGNLIEEKSGNSGRRAPLGKGKNHRLPRVLHASGVTQRGRNKITILVPFRRVQVLQGIDKEQRQGKERLVYGELGQKPRVTKGQTDKIFDLC